MTKRLSWVRKKLAPDLPPLVCHVAQDAIDAR